MNLKYLRWSGFVIVVSLLLLWYLNITLSNRQIEIHRQIYSSRGYQEIANAYIDHGWLKLRSSRPDEDRSNPLKDAFGQDVNQGEIYLDMDLKDDEAVKKYFNRSYLKMDVAAYNRGNKSIFHTSHDQLICIDPYIHQIPLPFADIITWKGDLTYRPSESRNKTLHSLAGSLVFKQLCNMVPQTQNLPKVFLPFEKAQIQMRKGQEAVLLEGRCPGLANSAYVPPPVHLGIIYGAGDDLLFRHLGNMRMVGAGKAPGPGDRIALRSGDILRLEWNCPSSTLGMEYEILQVNVEDEFPLISSYRYIKGRQTRIPERPEPPIASDVAIAVSNALQHARHLRGGENRPMSREEKEEKAKRDLKVTLTLDERLQKDVQQELGEYCESIRLNPVDRRYNPEHSFFRAAVAVTDTLDGEVLAIASYPTEADIERNKNRTGKEPDPLEKTVLLRNHNFSRFPVGSVAKVIFTAAILDSSPMLQGFMLQQKGGDISTVLGLQLTKAIGGHLADTTRMVGGKPYVTLESFIECSSNRYAAFLWTLATGMNGDQIDQAPPSSSNLISPAYDCFYISHDNGAIDTYRYRPALRLNMNGAYPGVLTALDTSLKTFRNSMSKLFDVETVYVRDDSADENIPLLDGNDAVDTHIWRPVLTEIYGSLFTKQNFDVLHLDEVPPYVPAQYRKMQEIDDRHGGKLACYPDMESELRQHPFYGVSPERENLRLNLISNYRGQFLSQILGGGESTWTTLKLCEAWSRLITGKKVTSHLVMQIGGKDVVPKPKTLPYIDDQEKASTVAQQEEKRRKMEARKRLVNAMTLVAGNNGTAHLLNAEFRALEAKAAQHGMVFTVFSKTGSPDNDKTVPSATSKVMNNLFRAGVLAYDPGSDAIICQSFDGSSLRWRAVPLESGEQEDSKQEALIQQLITGMENNPAAREIFRKARHINAGSVINICADFNARDRDGRARMHCYTSGNKVIWGSKAFSRKTAGGVYVFTMALYPMQAALPAEDAKKLPKIDVLGFQPIYARTVAITVQSQGNSMKIAVPLALQIVRKVFKDVFENAIEKI